MRQPLNLLKNIKRIFNKKNPIDENQDRFNAICDLLYYSIRNGDEKVAKTISDFIYDEFDRVRLSSKNEPIEFPIQHYILTNKLTQLLVNQNNKNFDYLKDRATGGTWLLGERIGYTISETTYNWLWQNLKIAVEYRNEEMIIAFWKNAHQYISFRLDYILPDYIEGKFPIEISNQEEINQREKERQRFLQFTTALGGLLIYSKQYGTIKRCFRYTQSTPPRYELLPDHMSTVFEWFIHFSDPYSENYRFMDFHYSFPNIEGLNQDGVIKQQICKYIALLFLRQYTLHKYLSIQNYLSPPNIKDFSQAKLKLWLENIDFFKTLVKEVYEDRQLLNEVGVSFLTDGWIRENDKPQPLEFIDNFKRQLEEKYGTNEISQEILPEKKREFIEATKNTLERAYEECNLLNNKKELTGEVEKGYITGGSAILNKAAFSGEQGVSYLDFDSTHAYYVSKHLKDAFFNSFFIHKTEHYLLPPEDVFKAIDKLNIDNSYIIVAFGLNFDYLIENLKIKGLSKTHYKEANIQNFKEINTRIIGRTIFVIRKDDLPKLNYLDISREEKDKYQLGESISDKFPLYASLIDLNQNDDIRVEEETAHNQDLSKNVLAYIAFRLEVQWKKGVNCISIKEYTEYLNEGIPNTLSDVKPIKEKEE